VTQTTNGCRKVIEKFLNSTTDHNLAWFMLGLAVGAIGATLLAILLIYIDSIVGLGL